MDLICNFAYRFLAYGYQLLVYMVPAGLFSTVSMVNNIRDSSPNLLNCSDIVYMAFNCTWPTSTWLAKPVTE